jgi:DNA-binding transcriptional ArsR family regulator
MTVATRIHLSEQALESIAGRFRSLSEPVRLKIIRLLEKGEMSVGQLVDRLNTSQANVSKHLKVLVDAGILSRRTQGTSAFYSICDPVILKICDAVCNSMADKIKAQAQGFGLRVLRHRRS